MGLVRTIFSALVGPLIIYALLMSHAMCRMFLQTPSAVTVPDFPRDTKQEVKDAIISSRKALIKDTMDALAGKLKADYVSVWCTDDVEFEDPLQRYEGAEEVALLFAATKRYVKSNEIAIHGEHHGPHEIVMDWTMKVTTTFLPGFPLTLPMRSHLLLEPPTKAGQPEKLFRMREEWYGNELLGEKSTIGVLGRLHQKLRRFVGYAGAATLRTGYI